MGMTQDSTCSEDSIMSWQEVIKAWTDAVTMRLEEVTVRLRKTNNKPCIQVPSERTQYFFKKQTTVNEKGTN